MMGLASAGRTRHGFWVQPSSLVIRKARPGDEVALFALIRELAVFEQLEHELTGSAESLARDLFGPAPRAEALLAEVGGSAAGFALFFTTYSTFLTRAGIYLEDLFVRESQRGTGIGRQLLSAVAQVASQRGAGRLEWSVLDWNERAVGFYRHLGATLLDEWRICRVTGQNLAALAARGGAVKPLT
jgi:GNAT superfamily N-acetyltransferase